MTSVRESVHRILLSRGIDTMFGNPGSTEMRFFRNFPTALDYVLVPQEASVIAMADGWAQASGRVGVAMVHSAAGLGHGLGSLFSAERNQTPLLVIAGQQTRSLLAHEPYLYARDAAEFPRPYVKFSVEPARPQDVPAAIAQALDIAAAPPFGPVFVSVPEDDWDQTVDRQPCGSTVASATLSADAVDEIAAALRSADSPAIVLGAEVATGGVRVEAVQLAQRTGSAIWVAPLSSRAVFPEDHPQFAGFLQPVAEQVRAVLATHDVVLVLGAPVVTEHVPSAGGALPPGTRLIQITGDPASAARAEGGERFIAPVGNAVRDLVVAFGDRVGGRSTVALRGPATVPEVMSGDALAPEHVLATLAGLLPDDAVIVEEAPTHRNAIHEHLPVRAGQDYYVAASGGLGWAMPASVGIALAEPGRTVVCLIGDGSSLYSIQALWTAARRGVNVTTIVLNNGGYAAMKAFGRRLGVPDAVGLDLPGVDLPTLAEGFAVPGVSITDPADLVASLRKSLESGAPSLLDIHVGSAAGELY